MFRHLLSTEIVGRGNRRVHALWNLRNTLHSSYSRGKWEEIDMQTNIEISNTDECQEETKQGWGGALQMEWPPWGGDTSVYSWRSSGVWGEWLEFRAWGGNRKAWVWRGRQCEIIEDPVSSMWEARLIYTLYSEQGIVWSLERVQGLQDGGYVGGRKLRGGEEKGEYMHEIPLKVR